jgi:hypothetical protein
MRDPHNIGVNDTRCKWDNEFKAIFQLDVDERRSCSGYAKPAASAQEYGIVCARYDLQRHQTLGDTMEDWFENDCETQSCATCGRPEVQVLFRRIEAAPQVSRIKVDLYTAVGGVKTKQGTPFTVPDVLDLRRHQTCQELPLGYTLSSAIAHGGVERADQILFHVSEEFVQQASQTIAEAVSRALQNIPDKGRSGPDQSDDSEDAVDEKEDDLARFEAMQDEPEEGKTDIDRMDDDESDMMDDLFGDTKPEWFNDMDTTEDAQSRLKGHGSLPPEDSHYCKRQRKQ